MLADKIIGNADQLQELGIVRRSLKGDGERLAGKLGFAAHQLGPGEAAQRFGIVVIARKRRVEGNQRFGDLAHFEQRVAGSDERRHRLRFDCGGTAIDTHRVGEIAAGLGRGANAHQGVIAERLAAAIAAIDTERIKVKRSVFASGERDCADREEKERRRVEAFHSLRTRPLVQQIGGPPAVLAFQSCDAAAISSSHVDHSLHYKGLESGASGYRRIGAQPIGKSPPRTGWRARSARRRSGFVRPSSQRLFDGGERRLGAVRLGPARLSHIGPAATAFAAQRLGSPAHQLDSVEPIGEVGGHPDDDRRLSLGARHHGDDAGTDPPLQIVGERTQLPARHVVDKPSIEGDTAIRLPAGGTDRAPPPAMARRASASSRSSQRCSSMRRASAGGQLGRAGTQGRRRLPQQIFFAGEIGFGRSTGQGLDSAYPRRDRAFA